MGAWRTLCEDDLDGYGVGDHAAAFSRAELDALTSKPGRPIGHVGKGEKCRIQGASTGRSKKQTPPRKKLTSTAS